jgi:hypothetical protein
LNEDVIQPASGFEMHLHQNMEILLMPLSGNGARRRRSA